MNIDRSKVVSQDDKDEQALAGAISRIAARRYQEEVRGVTVDGLFFSTERSSQGMLTSAVVETMLDPDYVCNWKTPEGFVKLPADSIVVAGRAVRAHVQACFDREEALVALVKQGRYNDSMLNEGWP